MATQIVTQPVCEPVSVDDARSFLGVTFEDDDTLIASLIKAARVCAEEFTGRAFINKGLVQRLDSFPANEIKLTHSPLAAIEKIRYVAATASGIGTATIATGGTGHAVGDTLTIVQAGASGGTLTVTAVDEETGAVTAASVDLEGSGYSVASGLATTSDGAGENCTVNITALSAWSTITPTTDAGDTTSDFVADTTSAPPRLYPKYGGCWPSTLEVPGAIEIHYTAGYNNDTTIAALVASYAAANPSSDEDDQTDYEYDLRRADVPPPIPSYILQALSLLYDNRGPIGSDDVKAALTHLEYLLWFHRVL